MTDLLIECPKCEKRNCIDVVIACAIPLEIDDGEGAWNWSEVEAVGSYSVYQCWQCSAEWMPNEMMADDFIVEVSND